jgi:2-hydroxychromene-2-carboxylate isomerase
MTGLITWSCLVKTTPAGCHGCKRSTETTVAQIEYFYAAHSAYAYIGSATLMNMARAGGHTIVHRPYDLRATLLALAPTNTGRGATGSWTPARSAYFFGRELVRWAEHRGVPILEGVPTHHHKDIGLPNRVLIAARESGCPIDDLAHAMLEQHWVQDCDLSDASTLARIADGARFDGAAVIDAAETAHVRAIYAANTAEAVQRSVFGSPTYFVDGDMFYGQDRLELVARALVTPFAGRWPPA